MLDPVVVACSGMIGECSNGFAPYIAIERPAKNRLGLRFRRVKQMESGLSKREVELREAARHASDCALEQWLSFLGHRWNGLILWRLSSGPRSFTELSNGLSGITPKVLTERLASLTEKALVERKQAASFPRTTAYALTEQGKDLADHLQRFYRWAIENPLEQNTRVCQR